MTSLGTETATFRLAAPCLNQLRRGVSFIRCEEFDKERRRELFTNNILVSVYDNVPQTGRWVTIIHRNIPLPLLWYEYPKNFAR
jgi:hypothetical protein